MNEQVQNNTEFYINDMENIIKLIEEEPENIDFLDYGTSISKN
jgi:hypothetical protein